MTKLFTMTIGIPSSGKTTIREKMLKTNPNLCVVSADDIRFKMLDFEHTGRDFDPTIEPLVQERVRERFEECLSEGRDIFFDATNVTRQRREPFVKKAKEHGYQTNAIVLHIDPEVAYLRQKRRGRVVPKSVIYQMHYSMEPPKKGEFDRVKKIYKWATRSECNDLKGSWNGKRCKICRLV